MDYEKFYKELFAPLEEKYGVLDEDTITSFVGFSAGGPVSLSKIEDKNLYVTCELAVYPDQRVSSEGLKFELFSIGSHSDDWCRTVFTAIGELSFEAELGDRHKINITGLVEGPEATDKIQLHLFSKTKIGNETYGLYEVVDV
ncbi:MAG: hypothetical protein AMS22_14740 [Thiotrichales bacterium SG8_50]|nr:MAG: hypothetical protein AMS22_14740 [Thiotrichales bacterium SG8_50]